MSAYCFLNIYLLIKFCCFVFFVVFGVFQKSFSSYCDTIESLSEREMKELDIWHKATDFDRERFRWFVMLIGGEVLPYKGKENGLKFTLQYGYKGCDPRWIPLLYKSRYMTNAHNIYSVKILDSGYLFFTTGTKPLYDLFTGIKELSDKDEKLEVVRKWSAYHESKVQGFRGLKNENYLKSAQSRADKTKRLAGFAV
jgi:hypothetical protein